MYPLITADWLYEQLDDVLLLDASIASRADGQQQECTNVTIPSARTFDLKNTFVDQSSPYPNTLPTPELFEQHCRQLGINNDSRIVVFDRFGVYSSPRVWWLFQVMGHENIAVLDGGLPEWQACGYNVVTREDATYPRGNFCASFHREWLATFEQVEQNTTTAFFTLVDARSRDRFNGIAPEPRQYLQSGHIPNSVNIPYQNVLDGHIFKSRDALAELFADYCDDELVFSCGSGMTACIVMLAGQLCGQTSKRIYDGSWTEWAERNALRTD